MYAQAGQAAGEGATAQPEGEAKAESAKENVVDAEFEEVKDNKKP
jgi:hypothetical protein